MDILKDRPIGDAIVGLCTADDSVSARLAADPALAPGDAWQSLYGTYQYAPEETSEAAGSDGDMARAARCGRWPAGAGPSSLFLQMYRDVLAIVEESPDRAMVSPSLLGSSGTAPLTAISTIPDIARHMANVIARADQEVFLATNYWQDSVAARYLTNALKGLDKRAALRHKRIVVKIMYDRGSPRQLVDPHHEVGVDEYTGRNVRIPSPAELPSLDVRVINYHQPLVGTFHSKYMVVDRRVAILQSNNIQDNDNLEMMVHLEGAIVDSFYDMALLSWHKKLEPPLPSYKSPAAAAAEAAETPTAAGTNGTWLSNDGDAPKVEQTKATQDGVVPDAVAISNICLDGDAPEFITGSSTAATSSEAMPKTATETLEPNTPNGPDAATQSFLDAGKHAPENLALSPAAVALASVLPQSTNETPQYDLDMAGEVARVQGAATGGHGGETRTQAVSRLLNHTVNKLEADAPDCAAGDVMTPYLFSRDDVAAAPPSFPIAMVNRPPFGSPLHSAAAQPQNAAWLSALRHARKNVFIQTPTLNAEPLVPAIRAACERGLDVILYVCLGYNDAGELLPRQGGTNEMVAFQLYASLSARGKTHLHYHWYVAKDQTRPIPQVHKQRSCHIKLMIVDETVGIMGNGNQDTQSWYHSQEINVMLESRAVCAAWIEGLRRNQNTHLYGALSQEDGVWRDHAGREAEGAMGVDPGRFSWAKGIVGAVKRVQGKGGF